MIKIFSQIQNQQRLLLHQVRTRDSFYSQEWEREDLSHPDEFLQCASLRMQSNRSFRPHQHIWVKPSSNEVIAQESWVVIQGAVMAHFYDTDGSHLKEVKMKPGDVSFTFQGGHTYEILEDDTLVYEFKTGPYKGQKLDKVFLDEKN